MAINRAQALALVAKLNAPKKSAPVQPRQRPGTPPPLGARHMPPKAPTGISWGGRQFASPEHLVSWMNSRGQGTTVSQFLNHHPGLAPRKAKQVAARRAPALGRQAYPS